MVEALVTKLCFDTFKYQILIYIYTPPIRALFSIIIIFIEGLRIFGCHSSKIALKSFHGKYVVAESNGHANANRVNRGSWEIFSVEELKDGIALKSHHGKYLVAENNYEVNANRMWKQKWETFKVLKQADGTYAFRTWKGRYLVAERDGRLRADRTWIRPWEKFKVECVKGNIQ